MRITEQKTHSREKIKHFRFFRFYKKVTYGKPYDWLLHYAFDLREFTQRSASEYIIALFSISFYILNVIFFPFFIS